MFICYYKMRSLGPENYARLTALRRVYEERLIGIISDGIST
ncbi:hypothetical protein [Paracoccus solventivorans]